MKPVTKTSVIVILLSWMTIYLPSCKEEAALPDVTTIPVTNITQTSATAGVRLSDDGGDYVTEMGICWSTSPNPTISSNSMTVGTGIGTNTGIINGLTANTNYYVRAFATNSAGTDYGNELMFTTADIAKGGAIPALTTVTIHTITSTTAISGGTITDDGGGDIIARGITWSTNPDWYPYEDDDKIYGNGPGSDSFVSYMSKLNPGTTYYVRAFAVNSNGIAFGPTLAFTTELEDRDSGLPYGTVTDIDGNIYNAIKIGEQIWMAENLKTTKYNDGGIIPNRSDDTTWEQTESGAYCWYENDENTYKNTYGALYNWYAVKTAKLCPAGWHVPSKEEWMLLASYLGGSDLAGGKLKEAGTTHWESPNQGAINVTGFTALPGGVRDSGGGWGTYFFQIGTYGFFWSSTPPSGDTHNNISLAHDSGTLSFATLWSVGNPGISVRCLKD